MSLVIQKLTSYHFLLAIFYIIIIDFTNIYNITYTKLPERVNRLDTKDLGEIWNEIHSSYN